jgi:hypothetical protein
MTRTPRRIWLGWRSSGSPIGSGARIRRASCVGAHSWRLARTRRRAPRSAVVRSPGPRRQCHGSTCRMAHYSSGPRRGPSFGSLPVPLWPQLREGRRTPQWRPVGTAGQQSISRTTAVGVSTARRPPRRRCERAHEPRDVAILRAALDLLRALPFLAAPDAQGFPAFRLPRRLSMSQGLPTSPPFRSRRTLPQT